MPRRAIPCLILLFLLAATPAPAGLYLRVETPQLGWIQGDAIEQQHQGWIELEHFSQTSTYGVDPQTGFPDGTRHVGPLEFHKLLDSATIGLIQAMVERQDLTTFELDATNTYQQDEQVYLTITLINAAFMEDAFHTAELEGIGKNYRVAFDRIRWHDRITGEIYEEDMGTTSVGPVAGGLARLESVPNPTSGPTKFHFRLPAAAHVTLDVMDARGRRVARVFDDQPTLEEATVIWDGRDDGGLPVASGIYMVHMQAGEWLTTQKLAVLR